MAKILIIEDEKEIADLEKDYLEMNNFEVETFDRGDDGLDAAMKNDYDLVVLDLMLPGTDGFDICRKVRAEKNIPIIMVSAKKDDIDKIRGLGLGADDYITKPFSPSELVARVKAHLARYERLVGAGTKSNEIIEIRGLRIEAAQNLNKVKPSSLGQASRISGVNPADISVLMIWLASLRGKTDGEDEDEE